MNMGNIEGELRSSTQNRESAHRLLDTVPGVMRAIRSEMRDLAHGKFTVPQFRILNHLRHHPMTNRELAHWMGVAPPTMSRMIECLERKKLIQRERSSEDLRVQTVTLTPLGKRETEMIRSAARDRFVARLEHLNSEKRKALDEGLSVLMEVFP